MEPVELLKNYKGESTYQITVQGIVDASSINRMAQLDVNCSKSGNKVISTLTGEFQDQEALNGLLNILFDNRYPVLSVNKL